jgi:15-cis-phytoene synthase
MTIPHTETLPPEIELALAYTGPIHRPALRIFFELDLRLARILSATNEPMLGQMRLAWWRETLAKPVNERPNGDAVLDAIGEHWTGREEHLQKLVDAWENLLAEPPLGADDARAFAHARSDAMAGAFADQVADCDVSDAKTMGQYWALADLAANVSLKEEREMLVSLALNQSRPTRLRAPFKGVAVLGALSLRSLEKGGRPLMEGRGASITAIRAAFFGR